MASYSRSGLPASAECTLALNSASFAAQSMPFFCRARRQPLHMPSALNRMRGRVIGCVHSLQKISSGTASADRECHMLVHHDYQKFHIGTDAPLLIMCCFALTSPLPM